MHCDFIHCLSCLCVSDMSNTGLSFPACSRLTRETRQTEGDGLC